MTRVRLSRIFWIGAAAIIVAAALVALTAIVRGDFSSTDGRIILSLGAVLLAGGTLVVGLALRERRPGSLVALVAIAVAPVGFALIEFGIWAWVTERLEGNDDAWLVGLTGLVTLVAGLMAAGALLVARRPRLVPLAYASGVLAFLAAITSIVVMWVEIPGIVTFEIVAVLWILALLGLLLIPVLERFVDADESGPTRVLATLDDIELVATTVGPGLDVRLAPGERLVLRKRA